MKPYFCSESRIALLGNIAESWVGTPFAIGACVRFAGVDCVRFVAEVLRESGHLHGYKFPAYAIDGGDHNATSQVSSWLSGHPLFMGLDRLDILMPGDVLEFRIGRGVSHHVGIYGGGDGRMVWSAMSSDGVQRRTLRDATWGRRLVGAWRPLEGGAAA